MRYNENFKETHIWPTGLQALPRPATQWTATTPVSASAAANYDAVNMFVCVYIYTHVFIYTHVLLVDYVWISHILHLKSYSPKIFPPSRLRRPLLSSTPGPLAGIFGKWGLSENLRNIEESKIINIYIYIYIYNSNIAYIYIYEHIYNSENWMNTEHL